jgi:hypothetical protein
LRFELLASVPLFLFRRTADGGRSAPVTKCTLWRAARFPMKDRALLSFANGEGAMPRPAWQCFLTHRKKCAGQVKLWPLMPGR